MRRRMAIDPELEAAVGLAIPPEYRNTERERPGQTG